MRLDLLVINHDGLKDESPSKIKRSDHTAGGTDAMQQLILSIPGELRQFALDKHLEHLQVFFGNWRGPTTPHSDSPLDEKIDILLRGFNDLHAHHGTWSCRTPCSHFWLRGSTSVSAPSNSQIAGTGVIQGTVTGHDRSVGSPSLRHLDRRVEGR